MSRIVERLVKFEEWENKYGELLSKQLNEGKEVVRCGECKYASDGGTYGCMCEHFADTSDAYHRMWSGDFCSRGERRE